LGAGPASSGDRLIKQKIDFSRVSFLIVDDNKLSIKMVGDTLRYLGATNIEVTRNPDEALSLIKKQNTDVLITEWQMESMTGVEFLDLLRNSSASPNRFLPVIMLTGHSEEPFVADARDNGVTEFLAKPFTAKGFYARLVSVIARPRCFINAPSYFGPDRRRKTMPYDGDERRS
tara:strand:+ start:71499 stop:72020 length:522 start_codon:yes stop_codon:yes gene_type:complete